MKMHFSRMALLVVTAGFLATSCTTNMLKKGTGGAAVEAAAASDVVMAQTLKDADE